MIYANLLHFVTFCSGLVMVEYNHDDDQMETYSALLAICSGNSPVAGEFPTQRPVMRNFDAFFDLRQNKRLSKQSWGWWFETPSHPLCRHCNAYHSVYFYWYWASRAISPEPFQQPSSNLLYTAVQSSRTKRSACKYTTCCCFICINNTHFFGLLTSIQSLSR